MKVAVLFALALAAIAVSAVPSDEAEFIPDDLVAAFAPKDDYSEVDLEDGVEDDSIGDAIFTNGRWTRQEVRESSRRTRDQAAKSASGERAAIRRLLSAYNGGKAHEEEVLKTEEAEEKALVSKIASQKAQLNAGPIAGASAGLSGLNKSLAARSGRRELRSLKKKEGREAKAIKREIRRKLAGKSGAAKSRKLRSLIRREFSQENKDAEFNNLSKKLQALKPEHRAALLASLSGKKSGGSKVRREMRRLRREARKGLSGKGMTRSTVSKLRRKLASLKKRLAHHEREFVRRMSRRFASYQKKRMEKKEMKAIKRQLRREDRRKKMSSRFSTLKKDFKKDEKRAKRASKKEAKKVSKGFDKFAKASEQRKKFRQLNRKSDREARRMRRAASKEKKDVTKAVRRDEQQAALKKKFSQITRTVRKDERAEKRDGKGLKTDTRTDLRRQQRKLRKFGRKEGREARKQTKKEKKILKTDGRSTKKTLRKTSRTSRSLLRRAMRSMKKLWSKLGRKKFVPAKVSFPRRK